MGQYCVLVVEDDDAIRQGIVDALYFEGYGALEAADGLRALDMALNSSCDLILLDLVLPGKDGLEILHDVRQAYPTLPVIILTAKGEEADRIKGLQLGADDYVVKPFSVKELMARVQAVLRRSPERPTPACDIRFPGGHADLVKGDIWFDDDTESRLSPIEADMLRYLSANAGRVVSREELLSRVWHMNLSGLETRTVDVHIARLREKLRDDSAQPRLVATVRGNGYMFQKAEKEE